MRMDFDQGYTNTTLFDSHASTLRCICHNSTPNVASPATTPDTAAQNIFN